MTEKVFLHSCQQKEQFPDLLEADRYVFKVQVAVVHIGKCFEKESP